MKTGDGEVPLLLSEIMNNNLEKVKKLLEKGEHPEVQDMFGVTPLQFASAHGAVEYVELLLKYGADPKRLDYRGYSSLGIVTESVKKEDNPCFKQDFRKCEELLRDAIWPLNVDNVVSQLEKMSKRRQNET